MNDVIWVQKFVKEFTQFLLPNNFIHHSPFFSLDHSFVLQKFQQHDSLLKPMSISAKKNSPPENSILETREMNYAQSSSFSSSTSITSQRLTTKEHIFATPCWASLLPIEELPPKKMNWCLIRESVGLDPANRDELSDISNILPHCLDLCISFNIKGTPLMVERNTSIFTTWGSFLCW